MQSILILLVVWFLVSIPVALFIGAVFALSSRDEEIPHFCSLEEGKDNRKCAECEEGECNFLHQGDGLIRLN